MYYLIIVESSSRGGNLFFGGWAPTKNEAGIENFGKSSMWGGLLLLLRRRSPYQKPQWLSSIFFPPPSIAVAVAASGIIWGMGGGGGGGGEEGGGGSIWRPLSLSLSLLSSFFSRLLFIATIAPSTSHSPSHYRIGIGIKKGFWIFFFIFPWGKLACAGSWNIISTLLLLLFFLSCSEAANCRVFLPLVDQFAPARQHQ